jgi:aryl-alcohol dehydrogenase-like predicted oxidoreductase
MKHRKFGRTGISVSSLSLGAATFGRQTDEVASVAILDKAAEAGVDFNDSSNFYSIERADAIWFFSTKLIGVPFSWV